MNVAAWLRGLGLERYAQAFHDNDVDAETLRHLSESDLSAIGVTSVGHRRKLSAAIAALSAVPERDEGDAAQLLAQRAAEHRQLSVLYCDISTAAAQLQSLDPEDAREVSRLFHAACARVVADYDGHVANFYGDCMLVYFGWPRAHEDEPERAVRAGLALLREVQAVTTVPGVSLSARVGIATGSVVVGDLIREGPAQAQSAVGVTPNLGARVLSLAAPGQVLIDELTRRLLGARFVLQPLGSHTLKGFDTAVTVYAVGGEHRADSRFDAHAGHELAPMLGRDQELGLLMERWAQAQGGEGGAVLLVGEAGIGKSRITRALLDVCASQPHWRVRWQCSPYHTGSALWPVIQRLSRSAGLEVQDSSEQVLDKLQAVVGSAEAAALYATLLGLNGSQRYGPLEMTPQMLRERTLELLVEQLFEMAEQRPLLLVVEDAHWIDPTTLELLDRCLERIERTRVLIHITSRPDNQPTLGAHPNVTRLSLNRLSRASVRAIVSRLGGDSLQERTLATIVAQTDGVPLFVEELTKAVLETGEAAIPASLHGSLMARLDRAPEVKDVAQIAACIGRHFDHALLASIADRPEAALRAALDKLVAAELIFRRGTPPTAQYTFKHALVQEAAYEGLLRARRQELHQRILANMENDSGSPPELLAHHAACAAFPEKAIDYWQQAGDAALSTSAYHEAASYFSNAVELIPACTNPEERRAQELQLQAGLGHAFGAARGQGSPEAQKAFARAHELFEANPEGPLRSSVFYGLWAGYALHGEHARAAAMAEDCLAAEATGADESLRMIAHRVLGTTRLQTGKFAEARTQLTRALELLDDIDRIDRSALVARIGHDPAVPAGCHLGWTLCQLGFADQGLSALERARAAGSAASHVLSEVSLHQHSALVGMLLRDKALVQHEALALAELAARHRLRMYQGYAALLHAWTEADSSGQANCVAAYEKGLEVIVATGTRTWGPFLLLGLAELLAASGETARAHRVIERAIVQIAETGEGMAEAELWRVRGELFSHGDRRDRGEAARCLEHALSQARAQQARLWELRAAASLARLWADQRERGKAIDLLAPVFSGFTEGLDTVDLKRAVALLEALS